MLFVWFSEFVRTHPVYEGSGHGDLGCTSSDRASCGPLLSLNRLGPSMLKTWFQWSILE